MTATATPRPNQFIDILRAVSVRLVEDKRILSNRAFANPEDASDGS
jgi:hypothetical protein